jgi:hypothetical protein
MDVRLREAIGLVRQALDDDPAGIVIGDLRPPNPDIEVVESPLSGYFEFLRECDGARCGVIDLWSYGELSENQFRVAHLANEADRWICVGQLLYEPLAIDRQCGEIRRFRQDPPPDTEGRDFGLAAEFLRRCVFGPGYLDLVPDPATDGWCILLRRLGLLDSI